MTSDRGPWILTASGKRFFLFDPQPEEIDIVDIAHALANICRFGGHTKFHYSVAQHSVLVSEIVEATVPELAFAALLHDATEAYVGDMVRPLKKQMPAYREVEDATWIAIAKVFALPEILPPIVKRADMAALLTERRDVMLVNHLNHPEFPWEADELGYEPSAIRVRELTPGEARVKFMHRLVVGHFEFRRGTPTDSP